MAMTVSPAIKWRTQGHTGPIKLIGQLYEVHTVLETVVDIMNIKPLESQKLFSKQTRQYPLTLPCITCYGRFMFCLCCLIKIKIDMRRKHLRRECLTRLNSFLWQHGAAGGLHVSIYINLLSYLKIKGRIGVLKFCNGTPVINTVVLNKTCLWQNISWCMI